ncbi:hypothetical protein NLJ89_g508 [Agrocybe chaxingu]|uniref:Uncharacterized protein n=1 Tax=Agrocybe chaxingu TaxID=84603 RepID=A0A9W8TF05_9AGAR|nr:hypothetical protein NLJ89_g508 [Agrocybe chaxingu]
MTIDDILDADVDKLVERTKLRPIPREAITMGRAWFFFSLQVVIGVGLARWMNFAPIPLGLMFNVGIFMGWAELTRESTLPWNVLIPAYVGTCLWTITYETVYQHQDKIDDVKIGLHSPALFLGDSTIPVCATTGVGFIALLVYAGALNGHGWCYYSAVAFASVLLMSRLFKTDIDKPEDCKRFFLQTVPVGQIILSGIVGDVILNRLVNDIAL